MGPLEAELAEAMKLRLPEAELAKKLEAAQVGNDPLKFLTFVNAEMYGPIFANLRDAILRLAREVDELHEQRDH